MIKITANILILTGFLVTYAISANADVCEGHAIKGKGSCLTESTEPCVDNQTREGFCKTLEYDAGEGKKGYECKCEPKTVTIRVEPKK